MDKGGKQSHQILFYEPAMFFKTRLQKKQKHPLFREVKYKRTGSAGILSALNKCTVSLSIIMPARCQRSQYVKLKYGS